MVISVQSVSNSTRIRAWNMFSRYEIEAKIKWDERTDIAHQCTRCTAVNPHTTIHIAVMNLRLPPLPVLSLPSFVPYSPVASSNELLCSSSSRHQCCQVTDCHNITHQDLSWKQFLHQSTYLLLAVPVPSIRNMNEKRVHHFKGTSNSTSHRV